MAATAWLYEKRPLKRQRLGAPDVYPQDPKQREDELTAVNVKQGFISNHIIQDEYGTAKNSNITAAKFGAFFSAILTKKQELNTFSDTGKRRQQINIKDNFWPVTARSKNAIEAWFKDLAGSKPLNSLAKRVPIFNKKEEIFMTLYEYAIPMVRATWFVKMSSAYTVAISEAKIKKRQLPDQSQEWTQALCKFLKEQLIKIAEHYHSGISLGSGALTHISSNTTSSSTVSSTVSGTTGSGPTSNIGSGISVDVAYKQWQYCVQLVWHLYGEGLLDRQDFLTWVLELLEKVKSPDDPIMKLVMTLILQYVDEFVHSELLSRRLGHHCAKKLAQLVNDLGSPQSPRSQSPVPNTPSEPSSQSETPANQTGQSAQQAPQQQQPPKTPVNPVSASFSEFIGCPFHRSVVLQLSAVLQVITLDCPTALIWNNIGEGKSHSILNGSPLDLLPFAPSSLPMPPRPSNPHVRLKLQQSEQLIRQRSWAAEVWWSCEKWQQTATSETIKRVLSALDALDKHQFDRVDSNNCLDTLYSKIFPSSTKDKNSASNNSPLSIDTALAQDEPIVQLLCEWSVTTRRSGEHRALVVAKLLEKRQYELLAERGSEGDFGDEKDSQDSLTTPLISLPVYQNLLVNFLDSQAPVLDCKPSYENRTAFSNLVLLFAELIHLDIFSHDSYMCTLISRGIMGNTMTGPPLNAPMNMNLNNNPNIHPPNSGKAIPSLEPLLTGFMPDPSRGMSPGMVGGTGMVGPGLNNPGLGPTLVSPVLGGSVLGSPNVLGGNVLGSQVLGPQGLGGPGMSTGMGNPGMVGANMGNSNMTGASGLNMLGLGDPGRPPDALPMFDPVDNRPGSVKAEVSWDMNMDMDDARIDADLDKLLQHIKEGQQNMSDQPVSAARRLKVRDPFCTNLHGSGRRMQWGKLKTISTGSGQLHAHDILLPESVGSDKVEGTSMSDTTPLSHPPLNPQEANSTSIPTSNSQSSQPNSPMRHLLYTTHFPLPQDEMSHHDCNQRHILLFGVGRVRDEARHTVKKVTKEIMKLFSKKTCMDMADGGKIKKHAKEGFNFESAVARFQQLSYFDQHVVTQTVATSVIEMLNSYATGNSNYLPLVEYISFLFDLMELALNIDGIIEFAVHLLQELSEVEVQLAQKNSTLAGSYATSVGIYIVGVLFRYHCSLLVSQELTVEVFDGLCKIMKHVTNPAECSSAERCILCYLYDLSSSCSVLKSKHFEQFGPMYSKVKQTLYASQSPSALNLLWNTTYMIEYINNANHIHSRLKVDPQLVAPLNENASYRYSFVCNAVHSISIARDTDKLNEISTLCAELTASCSALSAEWLGVLKALCCSSNHGCGFIDVLTQVDVGDLSIHDNLAVFTAILVARRCFSLQDFIVHVSLPSLLSACPAGGGDQDAESGARLTCHLLLRLFKTSESSGSASPFSVGLAYHSLTSPGPLVPPPPTHRPVYVIKSPCDRHLLAAARNSIRVEAVLSVLKASLVLGDATEEGQESRTKVDTPSTKGEISISEILGPLDDTDFDIGLPSNLNKTPQRTTDNNMSGGSSTGNSGPLNTPNSNNPSSGPATNMNTPNPLNSTAGTISGATVANTSGMESAGLSDFAKFSLKQICNQDWVYERCLKDTDIIFGQDLLLDPMLSYKQSQRLLQMICHLGTSKPSHDEGLEQKQIIFNILQNLDQWTLRVSWIELQLMYRQCSQGSNDINSWLDNIARATIDVFQMTREDLQLPLAFKGASSQPLMQGSNMPGENVVISKTSLGIGGLKNDEETPGRVWLVAPLISKLPAAVQGKILRVAGQVLESGNWASTNSSSNGTSSNNTSNNSSSNGVTKNPKEREKPNKSTSLLSHQPFLSLVLMCLKGQDDQREGLLNSLNSQISQCLHMIKDEKISSDDIRSQHSMQEALQLRLSLVGGMFDMIQSSNTLTTDWAMLLVQLISYGVVDPDANYELFTTVLDMLAVLTHSTLTDLSGSERGEDTRKHYLNLVKKLKKEIAEKDSEGVHMVRQLLPLSKQQCEVITCEAMGSLIDTKGNKIAGFDSIDKKQGLQVSEKQKVSPWDLLEGHKNPAPLPRAWFGAVRLERKNLRHEEMHHILLWHTHSLQKPSSYYLDPLVLPPEDLEPPQETKPQPFLAMQLEEPKRMMKELPIEMVQSPRGNAKKPKQPRRRRQTKLNNGQMEIGLLQPGPPIRPGMNYSDPPMYSQTPSQPWYGQQQPVQQPQYYNPQQPPLTTAGPRLSHSKAALSTMLRARHPGTNFMSGGGNQHPAGANAGPPSVQPPQAPHPNAQIQGHSGTVPQNPYQSMDMMQKQRQQQLMMRQQSMRPQGIPPGGPGNMYSNNMQPGSGQTAPLHHLPPQNTGPINQGYGNYSNAGMQQNQNMMESRSSGMMAAGNNYNQQYMGPQAGPTQMMNPATNIRAQNQYMPQTGRAQYSMGQGGIPAPNVSVGQMGGNMQGSNSAGGGNSHLLTSGMGVVPPSAGPNYGAGGGGNNMGNTIQNVSGQGPGQQGNMQHMRHQQQLIAMQNQQQAQQQQQQTAALVAQLQRQQQQQQQHHQYHQGGPY